MLKPSMQELMKRVDNRYLLVNLAAQRARDLSEQEESTGMKLEEKAIKIALDEIVEDKIEYREGPKPQPEPSKDLLYAAAADDDTDELTFTEEPDEEDDDAEDELMDEELTLPEEL